MHYGYIRVSTDKQSIENQRFEINEFCRKASIHIDRLVEETVSGKEKIENRKLGMLLKKLRKGDVLICSELSRLGRNLLMIMAILNECMNREIQVWTIKDAYRLGTDISSKVLAFAFGLSAEIERNLISQRTREALARKKAEGKILGRPKGRKNRVTKLGRHEEKLLQMRAEGVRYSVMAQTFGVCPLTIKRYFQAREKDEKRVKNEV